MIPTENKNTVHFKQRLLPNCLPHDLEIVTVNGGEGTSQYHTPLAVAKFTGKRKKIKSGYFIATPRNGGVISICVFACIFMIHNYANFDEARYWRLK
jgi:hypothetical protein